MQRSPSFEIARVTLLTRLCHIVTAAAARLRVMVEPEGGGHLVRAWRKICAFQGPGPAGGRMHVPRAQLSQTAS